MNRRRFLKRAGIWVPIAIAFPYIVRAQRSPFTSPDQTVMLTRRVSQACSTVKNSNVPGTPSSFSAVGNGATSVYNSSKFTASSSYQCCALEFWMDKQGSVAAPTGNITAYIFSDSGGSGPSTQLVTSSVISATTLPAKNSATWVKFTLTSPYSLTNGTVYWMVLSSSIVDVNNYVGAWYPDTFVSGGTYFSGDAVTWTGGAARRWFHRMYA